MSLYVDFTEFAKKQVKLDKLKTQNKNLRDALFLIHEKARLSGNGYLGESYALEDIFNIADKAIADYDKSAGGDFR